MSHDAKSEQHQKILIADIFPGILLIGNISVTTNVTTMKKIFFRTYIISGINWYNSLTAIFNFNFCYF